MAADLAAVRGEAKHVPAFLDPRLVLMHQVMLADRPRMTAYETAIARTVRPGQVVADIGAGCLPLSLMALRHGARHVYAIEGDPQTASLARAIVADNGIQERLTVVEGDARSVHLPERADVLLSEMMGNLGPEEEMADILAIAAERHLREGGKIVPKRLITSVQAIGFDEEGWGVWSEPVAGFSLAAVRRYAGRTPQLHFFSRAPRLLSSPVVLSDLAMGIAPGPFPETLEIGIAEAGRLEALAIHFTAELTEGVSISNFPSYPGCNWAVFVWPLPHTEVSPGDRVIAAIYPGAKVRDAMSWTLDCALQRADRTTR